MKRHHVTEDRMAAASTQRPKSRSMVNDSIISHVENNESDGYFSIAASSKLKEFFRRPDFLLPSSEEEFAACLKMEGDDDKKAAANTYRAAKRYREEEETRTLAHPPKTPRSTANEIQWPAVREYSVEGAETAPHDLIDNALAQIVGKTKAITGVPGGRLDGSEPAPFVFLLQSTGYGKTRAVFQLAETKRKVVYLPWKSSDERVMPRVSTAMKEILDDANTDDRRMLLWNKFLTAVEMCAGNYATHKELFAAHQSGDFYTELGDTLHKTLSPQSKIRFQSKDQTPKQVTFPSLPKKNEEGEHYHYTDAKELQHDSLVVCLDEVTGLSDEIYRSYRRVAKQRGLLSIFADTATSICRVLPTNDHSSTPNMGKMGHFIPPLYELETIDIDLSVQSRLGVEDNDYVTLFCAGRPLWKTYYDKQKSVDQLLQFAEGLLTQSNDEDDDDLQSLSMLDLPKKNEIKYVDHNLIAVFACRFALGRESRMAPLLVKHSLATVIDVADDLSTISTSYPSEPILPEVSARYTNRDTNRQHVLHHVRCAFNNRTKLLDPPTGDVGEMCAAALLGYLMDIIRVGKGHECMSEPVSLLDLLRYFGATNEEPGNIALDWEVNFTHFIRPDNDPTNDHLHNMWIRRVAYYVPDGCDGLDILVAIKHISGGYGTLRIQVKNYATKITRGDVTKILLKLLPNKCPPQGCKENLSVSLLLCVGDVDVRCVARKYDNGESVDARSSPRNMQSPEQQQQPQLLWLAANFPSRHSDQAVKELATTLQQIAQRHPKKLPDHTSKRFAKYYTTSEGSNEQT